MFYSSDDLFSVPNMQKHSHTLCSEHIFKCYGHMVGGMTVQACARYVEIRLGFPPHYSGFSIENSEARLE